LREKRYHVEVSVYNSKARCVKIIDYMTGRKRKFGCFLCGKGVQFAHKVSHAKNRTKIIRRPNLHTHKMVIDGEKVKIKLCTKCKREVRRMERDVQKEKISKK